MDSPTPARSGRWRQLALWGAYLVVSVYIMSMWIVDTRQYINLNGYERARFVDMVYGSAYKPYVMRVLVPWLVRLLRGLLPGALVQFMQHGIYTQMPLVGKLMTALSWEKEYLPEYALGVGSMYASLLGFMLVLRRLSRRCYDMGARLAEALPLCATLLLPVFFKRGTHYPNDFPGLCLFLLGLLLIAEERRAWYYAAFVLGMLNKETTILLALPFALYAAKRMAPKRLMAHLALQVAIFAAIRLALAALFRDNPGGALENNLSWNVRVSLRPYDYGTMIDVLGVVLLIIYRMGQKPLFLRQCLWLMVPLWISYMVGGLYGEIRVFYEVYPILFLLAFQTIAMLMGWRMVARDQAAMLPT